MFICCWDVGESDTFMEVEEFSEKSLSPGNPYPSSLIQSSRVGFSFSEMEQCPGPKAPGEAHCHWCCLPHHTHFWVSPTTGKWVGLLALGCEVVGGTWREYDLKTGETAMGYNAIGPSSKAAIFSRITDLCHLKTSHNTRSPVSTRRLMTLEDLQIHAGSMYEQVGGTSMAGWEESHK